jgi:hypothetical protein
VAELSDQAWADICAAARRMPDSEARTELSKILFDEYPAFAYDRAREAARQKQSKRMLKRLGDFAELYRQTWLPRLPVDELDAILTGRAMPCLPRLPADEFQANIAVKTERDLWALRNLWLRTQAVWLATRVILRRNAKRKNFQREWLYHRLCGLWLDHFDGELKVSVPPSGGPPGGPLITFMLAALRQIVSADALPSSYTVRDAIDRERRERENLRQLV